MTFSQKITMRRALRIHSHSHAGCTRLTLSAGRKKSTYGQEGTFHLPTTAHLPCYISFRGKKSRRILFEQPSYVQSLKEPKQRIRRVRTNRKMNQVLVRHDNSRLYTTLRTGEPPATMWWTGLPHPPYSPDLPPSVFHLSDALQDALRRHLLWTTTR